ncbi:MAG: hypothetical protein ACRC37_06740 [Lentisphaeria bacterium]
MNNKKISLMLFFTITLSLSAINKADSLEFLKSVRAPRMAGTWAKMSGVANHKREQINTPTVKQKALNARANIYVGMRFRNDMMNGKVLFDDNELYAVAQTFSAGIAGATSNKEGCLKNNADRMRDTFGISVSDLTLSFLFWDFSRELPSERINLMECRVLELSNNNIGEHVRVWIYPAWLAPLKVQWFKKGQNKAYREAEFSEVQEVKKNLYMIKSIVLKGDSWKTMIKFNKIEADRSSETPIPSDIFPQLKR